MRRSRATCTSTKRRVRRAASGPLRPLKRPSYLAPDRRACACACAADGTELHEECVRKVGDLHKYDCLRANKASMAHGLEIRVPFLDRDMLAASRVDTLPSS